MLTDEEIHAKEQTCSGLLAAFANGDMGVPHCSEVVFFRRTRRRNDTQYEARRFNVHKSISTLIGEELSKGIAQRSIDDNGGLMELCWYDAGTSSDKLFILPITEIPDYEKMSSSALVAFSKEKLREVMDAANIKRCVLDCGDCVVEVFARVQSQASLKRKHDLMSIEDDSLTARLDDALHLSYQTDVIVHGDMAIVFNRPSFEFIFSYRDALLDFIDKNSTQLVDSGVIANGNDFVQACKGNTKRMQKLKLFLLERRVDDLVAHRSNIKSVIQDFGLHVEASDSEIRYDPNGGSEQLDDILRLINRLCVTDALTNAKMFAAEIENPDVSASRKGD